MSDSLQVGRDLEEVLAVAMRRIEIADFSFFCVCLLLQRETGGQLGETLENLSSIVRTRREVRQKTKALELNRLGRLKLDELITTRYSLDQINDGFEDLRSGRNIRGVVVYDDPGRVSAA